MIGKLKKPCLIREAGGLTTQSSIAKNDTYGWDVRRHRGNMYGSFTPSAKTRQGIPCSVPSALLRCLPLSKEGIAVNETYCKKISS